MGISVSKFRRHRRHRRDNRHQAQSQQRLQQPIAAAAASSSSSLETPPLQPTQPPCLPSPSPSTQSASFPPPSPPTPPSLPPPSPPTPPPFLQSGHPPPRPSAQPSFVFAANAPLPLAPHGPYTGLPTPSVPAQVSSNYGPSMAMDAFSFSQFQPNFNRGYFGWGAYGPAPPPLPLQLPPPPPPYVDHKSARKIKNDVNVHKDTIRIDWDEKNLDSHLISFTFDALVEGRYMGLFIVVIFIFNYILPFDFDVLLIYVLGCQTDSYPSFSWPLSSLE